MVSDATKQHWEEIYQTKNCDEVSWYQPNPKTSINLILSVNPSKEHHIIDGAGHPFIDKEEEVISLALPWFNKWLK